MNSFDLMKAIISCYKSLSKNNIGLYYDTSSKATTIGIEYVTLKDNQPLEFKIRLNSPKNKLESLTLTVNDILTLNNKIIDIVVNKTLYRVYIQIDFANDAGINVTQQQIVLFNTVLTVYERK